MENCYNEFIAHVDGKKVICADIAHDANYGDNKREFKLMVGHSPDEFEEFLKALNFDYDDGFGGQELYGYIWYDDGTWSSRGEYDGSEWWVHNTCPEIPQSLKKASDNA